MGAFGVTRTHDSRATTDCDSDKLPTVPQRILLVSDSVCIDIRETYECGVHRNAYSLIQIFSRESCILISSDTITSL